MQEKTTTLPVSEAYDRWSGFYDTYDNPMVFGARHVVRALSGGVSGRDVVEFGCGTGCNLALLKRAGAASLIGCDLSEGMLAQARQRDAGFALLHHDMMLPSPLPDGSADLVLFSLALEHVEEMAAPLGEAKRLMRPQARLAIVEIHPFLSLSGVAAHFEEGGELVRMPTFAHTFAEYLTVFFRLDLRVAACREWRPRDFGHAVPAKLLKRGADTPLLVEFSLQF
jgi:malonyl-CoA O-methyltransferase